MNLLLDTYALIWFLDGDEAALSAKAKRLINDVDNVIVTHLTGFWLPRA
jgi:PIN domain nuclease of toxin-antitoxin system